MFFYENQWFGGDYMYNSFVLGDCSFPYHFHRTFELIFVTEGTLYMTIDGKDYCFHENNTAFIFPNQLHSFSTKDHSRIILLIFPQEVIESFSIQYQNMIPEDAKIYTQIHQHDKFEFDNIYDCKSFLYQMCSLLVTQTQMRPYSSGIEHNDLLYNIINYVHENYKDECSLIKVSQQLGYDYNYLSKYFNQQMDITFTSYLNQYRISQSCFLLHNTKESISAIAMKCGYDTIRTFNRNFKIHTGYSPSEYRNANTRKIF